MKLFTVVLLTISFNLGNCFSCDNHYNNAESNDKISKKCLSQFHRACQNETIASLMMDASSKYPYTGLYYASNQDYGNYDECMSVDYSDSEGRILGKHCTLSVVVVNILISALESSPQNASLQELIKNVDDNTEEAHLIKKFLSDMFDVNKRIRSHSRPKLDLEKLQTRLNLENPVVSILSTCIPDQCTTWETAYYMSDILGVIMEQLNSSGLLYIDDSRCYTKEDGTEFTAGDISCIVVLVGVVLLMIGTSAYDYYAFKNEIKLNPLITAFSVYSNGPKLFKTSKSTPEQISVFNGMRFISMIWVIAGHGFSIMVAMPLYNLKEFNTVKDPITFQYIGLAPVAVDTFFYLSGFLLAFGYFKQIKKPDVSKQLQMIPQMILHRYLRLTPALAMVYFVSLTIYTHMGSGPLFQTTIEISRPACTENWHSLFFYYQNYYNYDDMCIIPTWYLSADMQMFLIAPLLLIPLTFLVRKSSFKYAALLLGCATFIAVAITIAIRIWVEDYNNDYDTHTRLSDYFIGLGLGAYMRINKDKPYPFSRKITIIIWVIVLSGMVLLNWPFHIVSYTDYDDLTGTAFFIGLYRPFWCCALSWIVFSSYHGRGGFVDWLLSRPIFQIGARLSYSMYLLHGLVVGYMMTTNRTPIYFSHYSVFYLWCGNFMVTLILSIFWVLAFESPLIIIEKILFGGHKTSAPRSQPERTDVENGENK